MCRVSQQLFNFNLLEMSWLICIAWAVVVEREIEMAEELYSMESKKVI